MQFIKKNECTFHLNEFQKIKKCSKIYMIFPREGSERGFNQYFFGLAYLWNSLRYKTEILCIILQVYETHFTWDTEKKMFFRNML